mmetsp:Transcript_28465/g.54291  ORF Transcript_28465/g.54291 Transcript_28465/m.54291 type:complete len:537 (+) Transcript_28465:137-1747(+)|eukprot:CAMPEP_0114250200 /NCGR_PEP_ID=MMETSP0058-20121206/14568_1 /TAXON_ID=36894 /ORGANISM="Pyramimonas parkeae, CCMP726" /LENGTH=536 /DNA_ID=CAMNT_0001363835 /DNA_START=88 /DNA_END=1698 /DNA_ORIENTATION=-
MGMIPGLPESDTVTGTSFLMAVYGYLLLQGANLISDGSELLLEVLDPGIIGGLVLPVLGALPDSAIIAMSGLGGTVAEAQEQVAVGMGTLAGSTIMLLTIAWAGSLTLGRCDLVTRSDGTLVARDRTLGQYNSRWDWARTGVTTDSATRDNCWPMLLSSFLYLIIQVPAFFGYTKDPAAAYAAFFISLFSLAVYCVYQVISPDLQKKKTQKARAKMMKLHAVSAVAQMATETGHALLNSDFSLNPEAVRSIFDKFDSDHNGTLDTIEVKGLVVGLTLGMANLQLESGDAESWFKELDKNNDGQVSFNEFYLCLEQWIRQKMSTHHPAARGSHLALSDSSPHEALLSMPGQEDDEVHDDDIVDDDEDEEEGEEPLTRAQVYTRAIAKMLAGSIIIGLFADPMVDAVAAFAKATDISAFVVSFVITPFASNASELVSSLQFASKKRVKNISLTYSQVYGAVTMNNTMCLAVFMALVAFRGLEWNFSSEVVVTMVSIWLLGAVATKRVTFPLWYAPVVMLMYPLSLGAILFLDNVLGWN